MKIHVDQVFEDMKRKGTVVLNILPKSDFKKLHIRGSESLPMQEDPESFFKEVVERFGKDKYFILYGDHFGHLESFFATQVLEERGMEVRNYSGGVQEWFKKGFPVGGTQVQPEPVVKA